MDSLSPLVKLFPSLCTQRASSTELKHYYFYIYLPICLHHLDPNLHDDISYQLWAPDICQDGGPKCTKHMVHDIIDFTWDHGKLLIQSDVLSWELKNKWQLSKEWKEPWPGGYLAGASSHTARSYSFDPQSGHIPRLWVQSGQEATGHCFSPTSMFFSLSLYIYVSLSLSISLPPSLPL